MGQEIWTRIKPLNGSAQRARRGRVYALATLAATHRFFLKQPERCQADSGIFGLVQLALQKCIVTVNGNYFCCLLVIVVLLCLTVESLL